MHSEPNLNQAENMFVYGTLKRGQCRETCWPVKPLAIYQAWTLGALVDLGPYPAMLAGQDRILGELWSFNPCDIAAIRIALDKIEVTNQPGTPNEYDRVTVAAWLLDGREVTAETYRYADQAASGLRATFMAPTVQIQEQLYVAWPRNSI